MQIFLLNPVEGIITDEFLKKLEPFGKVIVDKSPKPILEVEGITDAGEDKIVAIDPDFSDWSFDKETITKIPNLKAITLTSTSYSWVNVEFAAELGIPIINNTGYSTNAVAEWAITMALNVYRKVPLMIKSEFQLDFEEHQGLELRGKIAGVIGLGKIGTRIAELAQGLGMEVVYWSKNSRDDRFEYLPLEDLMRTADVVLPTVAQEHVNGLLNDEMLLSLKPEAIFISTIHHHDYVGRIYNHDLLLKLASEGKIFGYGFEDTPGNFYSYEGNVWAGAKVAWCTQESFVNNSQFWLNNIVAAAQGDFANKVN